MATKGEKNHNWRHGFFTGLTEYRYGTKPKLANGQQILKGEKRDRTVSEVMDTLRDWRSSPFEHEAAARAGLRSALCLDGHRWALADLEAGRIVSEALLLLGAERPTWEEGQREYTVAPENCSWCGCEVPEELTVSQRKTRFCSDVCARSALQHRDFKVRSMQDAAYAAAYDAIARSRNSKRKCEQCGKLFRPLMAGGRFCSHECSTDFKIKLVPKECPICNQVFKPVGAAVVYCSRACKDVAHRRLPLAVCKGCGEPFRRRQAATLYCSRACTNEGKKKRETVCFCECCGDAFLASTAKRKLCSKACEMLMLKWRRGQPPKKLTATSFDWLFHRIRQEVRRPALVPANRLTAEIFDGWFRRAG